MELWKVVAEFPDYAVSSQGRVKRIVPDYFGKVGRILKPHLQKYAALTLYRDKEPFLLLVHRLVCVAFHGLPPTPDHEVAHFDGDGHNNSKENLRWATRVENEADKIRHGRNLAGRPSWIPAERRPRGDKHGRRTMPERTARGERSNMSDLTDADIVAIRMDDRSRRVIATAFGVSVTMIGYIVRGISWSHIPMKSEN